MDKQRIYKYLRSQITREMMLTRRDAIAHLTTPRKQGTRSNTLTRNSDLVGIKHPTERIIGQIIRELKVISAIAEVEFRQYGRGSQKGLKWLCTSGKFSVWLIPVIQLVLNDASASGTLDFDGIKDYVRKNRKQLTEVYQRTIFNHLESVNDKNEDAVDVDFFVVEEYALPEACEQY